jgi:hypothetical protein
MQADFIITKFSKSSRRKNGKQHKKQQIETEIKQEIREAYKRVNSHDPN